MMRETFIRIFIRYSEQKQSAHHTLRRFIAARLKDPFLHLVNWHEGGVEYVMHRKSLISLSDMSDK